MYQKRMLLLLVWQAAAILRSLQGEKILINTFIVLNLGGTWSLKILYKHRR